MSKLVYLFFVALDHRLLELFFLSSEFLPIVDLILENAALPISKVLTLALEGEEVVLGLFVILVVGVSTEGVACAAYEGALPVVVGHLTQLVTLHQAITAHQVPI